MKLFSARSLLLTIDVLHEHRGSCERGESGVSVDPQLLDGIKLWLSNAEELFREIGLLNAAYKIDAILAHITVNPGTVDHSSLAADLRNVHDMILADMWHRQFVRINADSLDFVNGQHLFGKRVSRAFRSAVPDIQEAGNCIAIDSGTAAVFHLMRAVEWGLRSLCAHLGIKRVRRSNRPGDQKYMALPWAQWERMLAEAQKKIDKKIERLGPGKRKQDLQQFYYPLMQDLKGFKDAFRNHVMHGRETFSPKRASDIWDYVERFMKSLATRVSQ